MPTSAQLNSELTTDPMGMGYAAYVGVSDNTLADMLNSLTSKGAATIQLVNVSKGALLLSSVPLTDQLAAGLTLSGSAIPSATQQKWISRFDALRSADPVLEVSQMMPLLESAVQDGIASSAWVTAVTTRTGSRAEVLWGAGTVITPVQILQSIGK